MENTLSQHIFMKQLLEQYLNIKEEQLREERKTMFESLDKLNKHDRRVAHALSSLSVAEDISFKAESLKLQKIIEQVVKNISLLKSMETKEMTNIQKMAKSLCNLYIQKLIVQNSAIIEYVANYLFENNEFPIEVTRPIDDNIDAEQVNKIADLETLDEEQRIYYSILLTFIKPIQKTKKHE